VILLFAREDADASGARHAAPPTSRGAHAGGPGDACRPRRDALRRRRRHRQAVSRVLLLVVAVAALMLLLLPSFVIAPISSCLEAREGGSLSR